MTQIEQTQRDRDHAHMLQLSSALSGTVAALDILTTHFEDLAAIEPHAQSTMSPAIAAILRHHVNEARAETDALSAPIIAEAQRRLLDGAVAEALAKLRPTEPVAPTFSA